MGGNYHTNNSENAVVDIDPMDMSESMQEAMHRSNLDMRGHKASLLKAVRGSFFIQKYLFLD
ncbi:hypothetical protein CK203_044491 [Vitis vinifera]|uniref:Uncharacterized protein n=1 Tax=Vitis vinifera TaxID=29760 RepID=A0A438HB32_VITVI|nr:hypothetical protein CK203_044491 [Vitis vinifera]